MGIITDIKSWYTGCVERANHRKEVNKGKAKHHKDYSNNQGFHMSSSDYDSMMETIHDFNEYDYWMRH